MDKVSAATAHANQLEIIKAQLDEVVQAQLDARLRLVELEQVRTALQLWSEASVEQDGSLPLDTLERWRLMGLVARLASPGAAGSAIFNQTPDENAPRQDYLSWLSRALASTTDHLAIVQQQLDLLEPQPEELTQRWNNTYRQSRGVTAKLMVEMLDEEKGEPVQARPVAEAAVVGGLLSLAVWALFWLVRPAARGRQ